MNLIENLLASLAEEASEVVKHTMKAERFGLGDGYPGSDTTNAEDIVKELEELIAVYELLVSKEALPLLTPGQKIDIRENKKIRVLKYQEYSKKVGCLKESK